MTVQNQSNTEFESGVSKKKTLNTEQERQIQIQTRVVNRLFKEYGFYQSEANTLCSKVQEMKAQNACIHDIKHASNVYAESRTMVPQVASQLREARSKLSEMLTHANISCDDHVEEPKLILEARHSLSVSSSVEPTDPARCSTTSPQSLESKDDSSSEESEY